MAISLRRLGIAFGSLVAAALTVWLLSVFLPAGLLLTIFLGLAIYQDIIRRERSGDIH